MSVCVSCDTPMELNARFCLECGAKAFNSAPQLELQDDVESVGSTSSLPSMKNNTENPESSIQQSAVVSPPKEKSKAEIADERRKIKQKEDEDRRLAEREAAFEQARIEMDKKKARQIKMSEDSSLAKKQEEERKKQQQEEDDRARMLEIKQRAKNAVKDVDWNSESKAQQYRSQATEDAELKAQQDERARKTKQLEDERKAAQAEQKRKEDEKRAADLREAQERRAAEMAAREERKRFAEEQKRLEAERKLQEAREASNRRDAVIKENEERARRAKLTPEERKKEDDARAAAAEAARLE